MSNGDRINAGKLRWRNFPDFLTAPLAQVGAANEKRDDNPKGKYETWNFLKGLSVNDTLDCMKRHQVKISDPREPDIDPEDGVHHLAKVAWNALVALYFIENRPDLDDRLTLDHLNLKTKVRRFRCLMDDYGAFEKDFIYDETPAITWFREKYSEDWQEVFD